jgi:DnaJ-class molecular chaperone
MGENYCSRCKKALSTCPTCRGKGMVDDSTVFLKKEKRCPNCNGTGKLCPSHGADH